MCTSTQQYFDSRYFNTCFMTQNIVERESGVVMSRIWKFCLLYGNSEVFLKLHKSLHNKESTHDDYKLASTLKDLRVNYIYRNEYEMSLRLERNNETTIKYL